MTRLSRLKRRWARLPAERPGGRSLRRLLLAVATGALLASCGTLNYYAQAGYGQYELWSAARPVDAWLADARTDQRLRMRLERARAIRRYAVAALALPDNGSYKKYSSLRRPYVLWSVVATPELSLKPLQWCFPIAGCVAYRGYYDRDDAKDYAADLRGQGYDVHVSGVPAYSTLGWFDDPLISTFINYPDGELARLIFHELAHQVSYVPGDSAFNESFATAVEEAGLQRWLDEHGDERLRAAYAQYATRKQQFLELLLGARRKLLEAYASDQGEAQRRARKAEVFRELKQDYAVLKQQWGGYAGYDRFFAEPLSNAHLASVATYNDHVPAFRALLARERSFPRFYAAVRQLAALGKDERDRMLARLARDGASA
ncbi:MAG TPA: aminopeptidase [Telluria sp.]|nr:aminopeptidase [Telluria sp.]